MQKTLLPQELKQAAEAALAQEDYMTAMDQFAEAAESAFELGMHDLSKECGQHVADTIMKIAEIEQLKLPASLESSAQH